MHASEGNKWRKHALSIAWPEIVGVAKLFSSDEKRNFGPRDMPERRSGHGQAERALSNVSAHKGL